MKNIDVIRAFVYGEQAHTLNLMSSGDKLIKRKIIQSNKGE